MKLSVDQKKKLLDSATLVYSAYVTLGLFQDHAQDVLAAAQKCERYPETIAFLMDGKSYQLTIHQTSLSEYQITFEDKVLTLAQDENDRCFVSLNLNEQHTIGGKGKIELYRTHLLTLSNIIQKIEKEEDITNLLVALATGSGKTFVQALWLLVLSLAGFTGLFSLPGHLIPQFIKDVKRLLPDTVTENIITIHEGSTLEHGSQSLKQAAGTPIIASSQHLLDHHYTDLNELPLEKSFLIFDEQHLLMTNERQRLRLLTLSQRFLSMFLTATPDLNTYQNSGSKPVAIMSSGEKQKSGQGQFPKIRPLQTKSISELHAQKETKGIFDYFFKRLEKIILIFNDAIQPECLSSVHTLFDELPYLCDLKQDEQALRWRLQVPIAKKMLCIIEDNETLVNACYYLTEKRRRNHHTQPVYHNGNFVMREGVSMFFGIPDIDRATLDRHWEEKKERYLASFSVDEKKHVQSLLNRSLHDQIRQNMFHYLIEYVLSDISGLNTIEQNALRKRSPEVFLKLIQDRYQYRDRSYFYEKLSQDLDDEGASMISVLLADCSRTLAYDIKTRYGNKVDQLRWTENWFLDDGLLDKFGSDFRSRFNAYVSRNMFMGVFSGMEEDETPITDSRPFAGLHEERYTLYDAGSKAKKRKRTSIELLDSNAEESKFTPKYLNITETQADCYFQLGFMGIYISNKKTEGFSDLDLHTILNPVQHSHDINNHPKKQIQAIGRDRGLDNTQWGHYIPAFGPDVSSSFDLECLLKEDYYPDLFSAEKIFDQHSIPVLGERVGKEIIAWYHQHQEEDESIDPDQLKRQVLQIIADVLRQLNVQNTHNIQISRQQLPNVIDYAMKKLDQEIQQTKRAYQLSLFVRTVGSVLNAICECYFFIIGWQTRSALREHAKHLARQPAPSDEASRADQIYLKIIQQTNYKDLVAQNLAAGELSAWLMRKTMMAHNIIDKNARAYLKPEVSKTLETGLAEAAFPVLSLMLVPDKQALFLEKVRTYPGLCTVLQKNAELLSELQESITDEVFSKKLLTFLHDIPGLEDLQSTDIVNYPARLRAHVQWMQSFSLETLEPELQEKVIEEYALFLSQPEFVQHLEGLMLKEDQTLIAQALQADPLRVSAFVRDWMTSQPFSEALFLPKLISYFQLENIKLLPERIQDIQTTLADYQKYTIATQIHQEILPCLVNFYPLINRKQLLQNTSVEAIELLLSTRKDELDALILNNKYEDISAFFFSACSIACPRQINIEQERHVSEEFFKKKTQGASGVVNGLIFLGTSVGLNPWGDSFLQEYLNHLSLMLPFHQWEMLCEKSKQYPEKLRQLAGKDITSSDLLLAEINQIFETQFCRTDVYAQQQIATLRSMGEGQETNCRTSAQKSKITALMRTQCMPLLLKNIKSETIRLKMEALSDEALCNAYPAVFSILATTEDIPIQHKMHIICQTLVAPDVVQIDELTDPEVQAQLSISNLQQAFLEKAKLALLRSDTFQDKLSDFFHIQDTQTVRNCINNRENAEILSKLNIRSAENIGDHIRNALPELAPTRLLSERLQQFQKDIQGFSERKLEILDPDKLAETCLEQIQPILQHRHFRQLLQLYMGSLTQEDLEFILIAGGLDQTQAHKSVARMLRFKELMMQEDFNAFKKEFLIFEPGSEIDIKNYRFSLALNDVVKLIKDIMDIHGYYRQHDDKGMQRENIDCVLSGKLSETAKNIRIPAQHSFMSLFSRKIFFIQGTRLGLPLASEVFTDAHQKTLSVLEYIHDHILRPLWWSVNNGSWVIAIIAWIKEVCSSLQNGLFDESVFSVAKTINELEPLSSVQIAEADCPKDVITYVEQHIIALPQSNVSLFAPLRTIPEVMPHSLFLGGTVVAL